MSRIFRFTLLSILILFSFACGLITMPLNQASVTYWNNIPIMPQATAGQETKEKNGYDFTTSANAAEVQTFYTDQLKTLGWILVVDSPELIGAKKDNSSVEITIFPRNTGANVMIILYKQQ